MNPGKTSIVDLVWSAMRNGEVYSLADLVNSSGQGLDAVVRVLGFLTRYGFAEQMTRHEMLFRRRAQVLEPSAAMSILQTVIANACAREA